MIYTGNTLICLTLAKEHPKANLWNSDLAECMKIPMVWEPIDKLLSGERAQISESLGRIDVNMTFTTHVVSFGLTVVDWLLWGAIKGNPQSVTDVLSGKYPQLGRWYKELMEMQPIVPKVIKFVKVSIVCPLKSLIRNPKA